MELPLTKINRANWHQLNIHWRQLAKDVYANSSKVFEHLVVRVFELSQAEVRRPYSVRTMDNDGASVELEQIDGAVHFDTLSCIVESKFQRQALNIEPVAKLRNQLLRRPAGTIGNIFSFSGFTEPALALARYCSPQIILLWESRHITWCLEQKDARRALLLKYRHAIEENMMPNFSPQQKQ